MRYALRNAAVPDDAPMESAIDSTGHLRRSVTPVTKPESADPSLAAWQRTQHALAQMLAHDLRNPLAAMLANLSFLDHAYRGADGEVRETLADLHASCAMMLTLVDSMVTVSALESPEARAQAWSIWCARCRSDGASCRSR